MFLIDKYTVHWVGKGKCVFVCFLVIGWRMILKVSSGGDLSTKPSVYSMWADNGGVNEELADATDINSATTYKSSIIDLWNNYYIRAVSLTDCILYGCSKHAQ